MPLGNGAPRGLNGATPGVLADPRTYNTTIATSYNTGFTSIVKPGSSVYARVIASTPGLVHWWRMGAFVNDSGVGTNVIRPAAGPAHLMVGAGTVTIVPGLLPGDSDGAAKLSNAYLKANDYFILSPTHEIYSLECWVNFTSLPASDTALFGEWQGGNGFMLFVSSANLSIFQGSAHIDYAVSNLTAGKTYHIVACNGGTDYKTRIYVNGVNVSSGNQAATGNAFTMTSQFEVGQYAAAAGTNNGNFTIDEIAIYSRMLQPNEVLQHYMAGFARQ